MPKPLNVKVITTDAELEFTIPAKTTGQELFEQVVKTIGLREVWYFGLQYIDGKGLPAWLKTQKKITAQDVRKENPLLFTFAVKFFPEDVSEEIIQEVTKRLFFIQVRKAILNDDIYCPAEIATLLESYACQVKYGDYKEGIEKELKDKKLLPQRVLDQYKLTTEEWVDKIALCWNEHEDMMKDEAMLEYVKICQDLEMYGVKYFDIKNKKGTGLLMGVDALGINVYEKSDRLTPKIGFPWSEIRNISFDDKKFLIKPIDRKSPDFNFFTANVRTNKDILALSMGNHDLYVRRRKADTIEIQQMKGRRDEEKTARDAERAKKKEEKRKHQETEEKLREHEVKLKQYEEAMRKKEEDFERLKIQQQEDLQSKNRELERLMGDNNEFTVKLDTLDQDNENLNGTDRQYYVVPADTTHDRSEENRKTQPEMDQSLQNKLSSLSADLALAKDENKSTQMDLLHIENARLGKDKYKTLKQIRMGNTKNRIEAFEGL